MFVHLKYAYNLNTVERYIIWTPDTDVAVLGVHFAENFGLKEVYLRTGIKRKKRFIPMHKICKSVVHNNVSVSTSSSCFNWM